jgi:signal transduction histidine kinase
MSALLMGSRIQLTGICRGAYGLNGQIVPGTVWLPDFSGIKILEMASDVWASHPVSTIHALLAANPATGTIVQVKGQVNSVNNGAIIVIHDPTGDIASRVMNSAAPAVGDFVNVVGRWDKLGTNVILDNGFSRKITRPSEASNPLPILTTAEAIKRLQRDEALRGYPVKLQGVVTWVGGSGFVIQDSTMGIFSEAVSSESAQGVHAGEYLEVEGVTTAQFSPMVLARRIVHMGLGTFPDPIRPTWDQLMNGTLDTQYAEIQGIVTAVEGRTMTLLTHDGKLQVDLPEQQNNELRGYADALIRLRGCLWAVKDEDTHKLVPGEVQMHNASISVDQAAPDDFFDAPLKQVSELLLFDAKASALQRVAVVGQMIHQREDEYFLMDGVNGMRFITRSPVSLQIGDLVKVVGFPVLGGPAPVLREAVARRINNTNLPAPRKLTENTLLDGSFDSTLVKVDAQLMNISEDHRNRFLGLQLGKHMFVACLSRKWGPIRAPIGSSLEVAGVYAGQGQDRVSGRGIDSFELLLNSPDDIRVLSRPSWWTLRRMLAVVGVMAGILTVALMWIGLLRRQVEQRTGQLREEILVRQRSEQLRVVEEERSRIARDLHDDLGASLTEISMLADAGGGAPPTIEKADSRFASIGEKARAIVNALDVIVWLVNPSKDLLPFSVSYLGSYSEEYLCAAGIACRLKVPSNIPSLRLAADLRHNLFLAIKETLNNIVRHSRATEVNMEIMLAEGRLKIGITDNGKGFSPVATADGNGLVNLEHRLAQVGGECQVTSSPETGTSVVLSIPLPAN